MDVTHCCQQSPRCSTLFFLFQLLRSEPTFVPSLNLLLFYCYTILYYQFLYYAVVCLILFYLLNKVYQLAFTFVSAWNVMKIWDKISPMTNTWLTLSVVYPDLIIPFSAMSVTSCFSVSCYLWCNSCSYVVSLVYFHR